jgi:hypothetical protein
MAKSKFFRVAVEGATTDGRNIERSWLLDIAATYNPTTYGARIFNEHIRGFDPSGPFKAYGDVVAVKAEPIADGDLKGKMALFAQIEPTTELVSLVKAKQKIYCSIEVNQNFASSNRAYLQGLGVTDSPASLGTEVLSFAAQHPAANPFTNRKQSPDNLFSVAEAVEIEFEEEPSETAIDTLFKTIKEKVTKLSGKAKGHDAQFNEIAESLTGLADVMEQFSTSQNAATQRVVDQFADLTTRLETIESARAKADTDFAALRTQLESHPTTPLRPAATGGDGFASTNC